MKLTKLIIIFRCMTGLLLVLLVSSGWFMSPAMAQSNEPLLVGCTNGEGDVAGLINAINTANTNGNELDVIQLAPNCIYQLRNHNRTDTFNGLPVVNEPLRIEGQGATLFGRENLGPRHLHAKAPLTLMNLTLSRGSSSTVGGAVYAESELTLIDVVVRNNVAGSGGGVYAEGPFTVTGGTYVNNRALQGGGAISIGPEANLSLTNVAFFDNQADFGGAVAAQGVVFIKDSRFVSNKALVENGGGLFTTGTVLVLNSRFVTNHTVSDGGGMYALGPVSVSATNFESNEAERFGGGLYGGDTVALERNTFQGNQAAQGGSGLYLAQLQGRTSLLVNNLWADNYKRSDRPQRNTLCLLCDQASKGKVTLNHNTLANAAPFREKAIEVGQGETRVTNSIITNYDTGVNNQAAFVTTDHNLYFANFVNEAGAIPPVETHLLGQDPRFIDPANGDYTLQASSPAMGKAAAAFSELLDRRGIHRPQGNDPDIGAYEIDEGFIPASHVISLATCNQGEGDVEVLVEAFEQANAMAGANRIEVGANCVYTLETPIGQFRGPTGLPVVTEYLEIKGNGAIIQRSDDAVDFRIMTVAGAFLNMRNLTLQHGSTEEGGAGLYVDNFDSPNEALTLTNVTFRGNTTTNIGGGLLVQTNRVAIHQSRFEQNKADEEGGGAYLESVGDLRISESRFSTNTGDYGGAITIYYSQGEIKGNHFENNKAVEYEGGGVYIFDSTLKVTGNAFIANSALAGGGIYGDVENGSLNLTGNTFLRNVAPVGSGLLLDTLTTDNSIANNLWVDNVTVDDEASATITLKSTSTELEGHIDVLHNTIASSTQAEGEGVWIGGPVVRLRNNIITNHNIGIALFETGAATAENNLYAGNRFEESAGVQSSNKLTTDQPIFVDPASGDFHLRAGALAIDTGMDAGLIVDLDDVVRPQGQGFDIGAYEFTVEDPQDDPGTTPTPEPDPGTPPTPTPGSFSVFLPLVVK